MVDTPEDAPKSDEEAEIIAAAERVLARKAAPGRVLARKAVAELRYGKEHPFVPTPDIGMVWVISAPGTAFTDSKDGVYAGDSSDRMTIDHGAQLVREITSARLDKPIAEVTKDDVAANGPTLFYNGEDDFAEGSNYPQNQDLAKLVKSPDFPVPKSKVVIDSIEQINTIGQIESILEYIRQHNFKGKVAVVSVGAHDARVFRYLEKHKADIPEGVEFVSAPAMQTHNPVGTTKREIDKVVKYSKKGDMSPERYDKDRFD